MPDFPTELPVLVNGQPVVVHLQDVAIWVIVGLSAGFLASRLMLGHGLGPVRELLVGVVGAVLGNLIFTFFNFSIEVVGVPILSQIIVAFCGALVLVLALRLAGMGRRYRDRGRFRESRPDRGWRQDAYGRDDRYDRDPYYDQDPYGRYHRDAYEADRHDPELRDWRRTRG
jgi:uncharacterized membrane protein YeaQ/YmgE (transglycosylase-associated protein family)